MGFEHSGEPSLHDWAREDADAEADRERERFDLEKDWLFIDRHTGQGQDKIASLMGAAMNDLYCNQGDCGTFEKALFAFYCAPDSPEARQMILSLLDRYVFQTYRRERSRPTYAAAA